MVFLNRTGGKIPPTIHWILHVQLQVEPWHTKGWIQGEGWLETKKENRKSISSLQSNLATHWVPWAASGSGRTKSRYPAQRGGARQRMSVVGDQRSCHFAPSKCAKGSAASCLREPMLHGYGNVYRYRKNTDTRIRQFPKQSDTRIHLLFKK